MAIGNPVSYWYGTKAQYNTLSLHLADTLYFITDEQTIYKGDVRFAEGVEQLSAVDSSAPSSPAKYDKYFDTDDGKIYVYDGTSWGNAYYPAEGNMYYDKNAKRFVYFVPTYDGTTVTGGSMADVYDAGVSGDANQGVSIQGTSTVTVANASVNGKGVVKIGDNINVNNAGVISVSVANASTFGLVKTGDNITNTNGVISVAKATASSLGVVKPGDNINVDSNGQISVPVANGGTKGVVSAGENVNNDNGVLSVSTASTGSKGVIKIADPFSCDSSGILDIGYASTSNKGVVKVGTNIDVADGVISVKTATDENLGLVEISYTISDTDDDSSTPCVPTVKTVNDALALKQDNLTFDTTTGIEVISGTTVKNDIATVEEVLTGAAGTNIVDADGLKGAISLGQAVDVSCVIRSANDFDFSINGTDWISLSEFQATEAYLDDFYVRLVNGSTTGSHFVGFPTSRGAKFPKAAPGLRYLVLCDVCNSGAETSITTWAGGGSFMNDVPHDLDSNQRAAGQTTYNRIAMIMSDAGNTYLLLRPTAANTTVILHIKNWRQYEVTNLTDEAIWYLASATTNPNPDKLFRSQDFFDVSSGYMIKSDMVCPWTYLITMPTNSPAMTVASGLAYQLSLTDGVEHEITVDTFPTNAYGQDSHIQLLLANNSTAVFKSPLNLIDALTPNAAHNITVKFRAGQANVYVDDTDAGYIITVTSGTDEGSMYYGVVNTDSNYLIFNPDIDGQTCTMLEGTTVSRALNFVGNGIDKTIISTLPEKRGLDTSAGVNATVNFSHMTITGITNAYCLANVSTYKHGGSIVFTDCVVSDCVSMAVSSLMATLILTGCTISGTSGVFYTEGMTAKDCTFYGAGFRWTNTGSTKTWDNCVFASPVVVAQVSADNEYKHFVTNCSFGANDRIYVRNQAGHNTAYAVLNGLTKFNSISYSTSSTYPATSKICITSGSTLDLTDNTNPAPFSAYNPTLASIVGVYLYVAKSLSEYTVTDGTATVLYSSALDGEYDSNNQPFTKSRTISGGGANYIMRANGGMGVPVTTTTSGQAGSLDTLLADSTAEQITFAPVIDGTNVTIPDATTVSRAVAINGAGRTKTILAGDITISGTNSVNYSDMTIHGNPAKPISGSAIINVTIDNVLITDYTTSTYFFGGSYGARCQIYGSTFSNLKTIGSDYHGIYIRGYRNSSHLTNCLITGCSSTSSLFYSDISMTGCTITNNYGSFGIWRSASSSANPTITNCLFSGNRSYYNYAIYAPAAGAPNTIAITGSTFATSTDNIWIETGVNLTFAGNNIINSTISGGGTVAFADGATVTSTIPSGSTIGTGVISCRMSELTTGCMLENVTITGVTTSGSDLIKLQDGAGKVTLKNLLITGNTPSNYTPFVRTASVTDSVDIVGCTFTNTNSTFTSLYCAIGYMYIKDTTLAVSLYIGNQNSTMVIDGTVTANTMRGIEVYDGGGRVVFKPDSKIILNSAFSPAAGKEYILGVGTYEDGVFTETGTATAVIGGTTVSISGSGHYLDTDGIHN